MSECVIIEDTDLSEDEPGPPRKSHKPNSCRLEAEWFEQEYRVPSGQVKNCFISYEDIDLFKNMIWHRPHDRMVPGYGMTPRELASIPSDGRKGWLVSSHFFWLSQCLNKQTSHSRCFVFDPLIRKESVDKLLPIELRTNVTTLILVVSVGRRDNGSVFFGSDKLQGDHWALCVIDVRDGTVNYCDTLGWAAPKTILSSVIKYTRFAGFVHSHQLELKMAHEANEEQHVCSNKCTNYPLQKCSDVCGVVVMVCIAAAALDKKLFNYLMRPVDVKVNLYLREPTEYSCYLRYVLISWLAREHIDVSKISVKSDFDPCNSLFKGNALISGFKRKFGGDSSPVSPKRFQDCPQSSTKPVLDDVSLSILQNTTNGVTNMKILKDAAQLAVKKNKSKSYWTELCQELTFNSAVEICRDQTLSMSEYYQEFMKFQSNPIIYFNTFGKGQGNNHDCVEDNDIVLVVQTDYQREMLRTYSRQCVCVEWTRKLDEVGSHLNLLTMSVFVEGLYEVPVAWLISNRSSSSIQNYMFEALKKVVGDIPTNVFIGDVHSLSYKQWINHFKKPKKKMFCVWDIIHVVKSRLEDFITDENNCEEIKDWVSVFPYITDRSAFDIYKKCFLEEIKIHSDFHAYFTSKYLDDSKEELWASCYRVIPASAFVPFLKPFRHVLDSVGFFQYGQVRRIDTVCHKLMQFVIFLKRKLYIMTSEIKQSTAIKDIHRLHQQPCDDLDFFRSMSGEEWHFKASDNNISFSLLDSGLTSCSCNLRCKYCTICIHQFICTCPDYILYASGCKHIHMPHAVDKINNSLNGGNSLPISAMGDHGSDGKTESLIRGELGRISKLGQQFSNDRSKLKGILKALRRIDDV